MKLYSTEISPFGARVVMQIRLKNLPVEVMPPPEPLRSPELRKRFPQGRIPVLVIDDGDLSESVAIMEFLEDLWPEPPMRPQNAWDRARMRMLCRFNDLYLGPSLAPLFFALYQPDKTTRPATSLLMAQ